jgi:hypothetical protein
MALPSLLLPLSTFSHTNKGFGIINMEESLSTQLRTSSHYLTYKPV